MCKIKSYWSWLVRCRVCDNGGSVFQKEKKEVAGGKYKQEIRYHLWGWIIFLVCAFLFIASSLRNGDILMLVASFVFLAACIVFIVPLIKNIKDEGRDKK